MNKQFLLRFICLLSLVSFFSCTQMDYKLLAYKKITFQWNLEVSEVFLDDRKITKNEVYYINNVVHKIEWKQNRNKYVKNIYFNKSGRYYIADSKVYQLKDDLNVVDGN